MITRGLVWRLGATQLVLWGVSYYLIALFGPAIVRETGWSATLVFGGFSLALVTMGAVSPAVGRAVDRRGGRVVLTAGSVLVALGCLLLAAARDPALYCAAWIVLGIAMRMSLYDAAFAALVRVGGPAARRPISQITLLGGLASTAMWPVGAALAERFGWRGALVCYAGFAVLTVPLHLAIPAARHESDRMAAGPPPPPPLARTARDRLATTLLFASATTLSSTLNSAMSAHMIGLLGGLGLGAGAAVWASSLRGVGQSLSRLAEIASGSRLSPLALGVVATAIIPAGFAVGLAAGSSAPAALAFTFLYGAGFGLNTITRGTQPLVLFDPESYGAVAGRLIAPSFYLSALAPAAYAALLEVWGAAAAMQVAAAWSGALLLPSLWLWLRFRRG